MIKRYATKEMEDNWSALRKFTNWVKVEAAVLRAKVEVGELQVEIPENLESSIKINVEEINWIESEETRHDVIAFLMHTSPQLPEELRPYWHDRMTSYDTQDTALSLQLVYSIDLLELALEDLKFAIKEKAIKHKHTPQIGRSHGVHAEPITFGVKLANWHSEFQRDLERLRRLRILVAVGKISGAVGMYTLNPEIEKLVCK
ncbi:adenylosuccinate lyase, partial [Candidatus Parcubacteria bacterium]|nr:adenylosuccinate lyase [Candidatus Parcubacteria bacterium]